MPDGVYIPLFKDQDNFDAHQFLFTIQVCPGAVSVLILLRPILFHLIKNICLAIFLCLSLGEKFFIV